MKFYLVFFWVLFLDIFLCTDNIFIQRYRAHFAAIPLSYLLRYQDPQERKNTEEVIALSHLLIKPLYEFFAPSARNLKAYLVDYGWAGFPLFYGRSYHTSIKVWLPYEIAHLYRAMRSPRREKTDNSRYKSFSAMCIESDEHAKI